MIDRRPASARVHLSVLLVAMLLSSLKFWFLCDDSYITFRYSRNFSRGLGVVFNPGEWPPVEGYSNFLWMVYAALLEATGLSIEWIIPITSVATALLLVWRVWTVLTEHLAVGRLPATLATLTLALSPAVGVWATSGLATMPFALLIWLLFESLVLGRDDDWAIPAILGMGIGLIRSEGFAWVVVLAAVSIVARWFDRKDLGSHARRLTRSALPLGLCVLMYQGWRYSTFATLVPNTALVKVGFGPNLLGRGLRYVLLFWLTTLTPLFSLIGAAWALRGPRRGTWAAIALMAVGFPAYGVVVGGDFMPFGRLLLPGLPFAAALLGAGLQHLLELRRADHRVVLGVGLLAVVVGAMPGFDLHLVPSGVRQLLHFRLSDKDFHSEWGKWDNMVGNTEGFITRGRALAQVADPSDAVVSGAVGALGYYSDLRIFDQYGLVTKEVAYRALPMGPLTQSPGHDKKVEAEYFVKYMPRYLYARAVQGKLAAGRMKDTLDAWEIDIAVMDRYVPDFVEVPLADVDERVFLLMVRRLEPGEDPSVVWNAFPARRRALNAELRSQYADEDDEALEGGDDGT